MRLRARRDRLVHKVLRLSAFLFCAQAVIAAVVVRRVQAEVQDLMLTVGSQMMQLGERAGGIAPRTLRINGAQIRLRVQRVPGMTLDQVLDHFEARCRARNGRFYEQLQSDRAKQKLDEEQLGLLDGVMRSESDDAGAVACMDVGDEQGSPSSILARAQRFVETGDATSFGELRYVRAEKRDGGVFAVMMWTDGPLDVRRMFPKEGDAPGVDFPDLPRPPGSRRLFSAWEEGQAPALNVYESHALPPRELDAHYRKTLAELGWAPLNPAGSGEHARAYGLMVMRDGTTVTLSQTAGPSGRSMTTMMPMDTRGAVRVAP